MKLTNTFFALVLTALVSGCAYSNRPVGENPHFATIPYWEGEWIKADDDVPYQIKVTDAYNGLVEVTGGELKSALTVQLMESGKWVFANFKDEESGLYI